MEEVRDYMAQHGSMPRENPSGAGCALAKRIRMQLERGALNARVRAELHSVLEGAPTFSLPGLNLSSATGQEAGGSTTSNAGLGTTLSLPGLNINWPFSQLILAGVKTAEVRSHALGYRSSAQPDVEMWLVETPGKATAISD